MQKIKKHSVLLWAYASSIFLQVLERLLDLPRNIRQAMLLCLDLLFIPAAVLFSVWLSQAELSWALGYREVGVIIVTMLLTSFGFLRLGLYRAVIRFMGQQAIIAIIKGVTISALAFTLVNFTFGQVVPFTVSIIYFCMLFILIGGSRFIVRAHYHHLLRRSSDNVVIYGAGSAGRQLLTALLHSGHYLPVFFVDDDPNIEGSVINGVSVVNPKRLAQIVTDYDVNQVLLAVPSIDRYRRKEIINQLIGLPVHVRTIPAVAEIVQGGSNIDELQDIDIEDLLGRDPIPPQVQLIDKCIHEKVVMVTGAGGSIGSELCRQLIESRPELLVLYEASEYALYQIAKELEQTIKTLALPVQIVSLLGNVQDYKRLSYVLNAYRIDTIYHAAAYKHVPLVEYNMVEGIRNNIFGTHYLARAAIENAVSTFVLISTDKAVRPVNAMGASKRFAELILQAFAAKQRKTRFCMVRFGNVLGSSGSVVPLFRDQIRHGGPVTVTHPEVIRYFMTVQEAAQLVLQAGAMGTGGDVFVLNMGEPVKILDLAKRMIRLMGYEVCETGDEDSPRKIAIKFTGLRPGEKLYEELLLGDNVRGTEHPMIMRAEESALSLVQVEEYLGVLGEACETMDCLKIREVLTEAVDEYRPKDLIADKVWNVSQHQASVTDALRDSAKVKQLFPKSDSRFFIS